MSRRRSAPTRPASRGAPPSATTTSSATLRTGAAAVDGADARHMHATRAHTVFTLHLRRRTRRRGRMAPPDACLTLVDLAAGAAGGAHQYVQQQPQPVRARRSSEEAAIHSSLGALSTYLEALRTAQGGGPPPARAHRACALTRLVQPMVTGPHPFLIAAMASCAVGEADMADTIATSASPRSSAACAPPSARRRRCAARRRRRRRRRRLRRSLAPRALRRSMGGSRLLGRPAAQVRPRGAAVAAVAAVGAAAGGRPPRPRARLLCPVERRAAAPSAPRGGSARRRRPSTPAARAAPARRRRRLRRRAPAAAHVAAAAPAAARPFVVGAPARRLLG